MGRLSDSAEAPVAAVAAAAPERLAARAAVGQLREAIVAHQPDMKKCVDRQLKAVPTLRAEGKLVSRSIPAAGW